MKKLFILCLTLAFTFSAAFAGCDGIQTSRVDDGILILKINTREFNEKIKPLVVDELTTAKEIYETGNYELVLNGGFFDMQTGGEISYVTIDCVEAQSPWHNTKLMRELEIAGRTDAVLNRSELRIVENKNGKTEFKFAAHYDLPEECERLIHSLQAGPALLPEMDLAKESFIQYGVGGVVAFEAASVTKRRARTVLAFKGHREHELYIVVFTNSNKVTLKEARDFLKKQGFKRALALDGGGSTSLYYDNIEINSEGPEGRKLKSFLVIEK